MSESIIDRLERILLWADERGLDETECRAMRDAVREIERLQAEVSYGDGLQERMADILTRTAKALRGKPPENGLHSWHDLPERVEQLREERDEVRQSYCSLMEAYRGGDGRVTANKLGWGYLFPRRPKKEDGK